MDKQFREDIVTVELKAEKAVLLITLTGALTSKTVGRIWSEVTAEVDKSPFDNIVIDADSVSDFDGSGASLLINAENTAKQSGKTIEIRNLDSDLAKLCELMRFRPIESEKKTLPRFKFLTIEVGKAVSEIVNDFVEQVSFAGQLVYTIIHTATGSGRVRWKDVALSAEKTGANAFGIVSLLGFLIGLILAFQSAISLKQFGAEIYVADFVSISVIRELGPLITAIILAGRTGSAFAAEIGTMKINEEVDALTTMGIDPFRFLVITRIAATVMVTPVLTVFANLFALIGCGLVVLSIGFPVATYLSRLASAVSMTDFLGGMFKSLVFGFLVASVGCLRGMQTKSGASAVGNSATRAVVSAIVLIVLADGIFAILFYYLGI